MPSTPDATTADPRDVLDTPQAARRIGKSVETLIRWRRERTGPTYIRLGRAVRYRPADLDAWLEERAVHPSR